LLDGLDEGRRYEVRVCWIATVGGLPSPITLFAQSTAPLCQYSYDRLCSETQATLRNTCSQARPIS
jgi:hypothetical protein